jgi:hypothetical protein
MKLADKMVFLSINVILTLLKVNCFTCVPKQVRTPNFTPTHRVGHFPKEIAKEVVAKSGYTFWGCTPRPFPCVDITHGSKAQGNTYPKSKYI